MLAVTALLAQSSDEPKPAKTFNIAVGSGGFGGGSGGAVGGFTIALHGMGEKLLKQIDTDKDGAASYAEFKTILNTHFQKWDANQSGTLSTNELSAGLKAIFPAPEIFVSTAEPPVGVGGGSGGGATGAVKVVKHFASDGQGRGFARVISIGGAPGDLPPLPEPSAIVARRVLKSVDADENQEITMAEWETITIKWYRAWDSNEDGYLSADDLGEGFHQLAGPPDDEDLLFLLPE
ncbi:MAG: hypothetical protein K0Q55_1715 [Verrucomicrobia bacterium]|nr:hypothetical protein [Verrucomicrobiota bacterium]